LVREAVAMSLSKVFKESKLFHPEEILPRPPGKKSHWPTVTEPQHSFKGSAQLKNAGDPGFRHDLNISPTEQENPTQVDTAPPPVSAASIDADTTRADIDEQDEQELTAGIDPLLVERMVEEAFQRGVAEGLQQAEKDFGSALHAFIELCRQLDQIRETILKNSVGEMQDLVLAIAEKIIRSSVLEQDATLLATVDEALHSAVKSDEFYVYVNPEDFDTVQGKAAEFVAGLNGLNNIVVKKDSTVERGGCKVESDNCTVDATIASQFEIIREQVKGRLTQS
jgi:flagellar assembly protein FliH